MSYSSMPSHVRQQVDGMIVQRGDAWHIKHNECKVFIRDSSGVLIKVLTVSMREPLKPQIEYEIERLQRLRPNLDFTICHE